MSGRRIIKPQRQNGIIAGVCGGLGAYFGFDPWIFRIAFILLTIAGVAPGILLYVLLWVWMPVKKRGWFST